TYNYLRTRHPDWSLTDVLVQTGVQRLRPVFLTTFTTGLGLLPLAMGVSIDLVAAEVEVGGPVASQWKQLANAVVFGLGFGTVLTLIVTPAMLALPTKLREHFARIKSLFSRQRPAFND
ncbi:MAG TPA: AcrB/AcrD/AcrF family protein, partial [Pseudohongiella sp.]|nr:AcrB/AcrD/AcrF family protein [Pseudohongiella sp.]